MPAYAFARQFPRARQTLHFGLRKTRARKRDDRLFVRKLFFVANTLLSVVEYF